MDKEDYQARFDAMETERRTIGTCAFATTEFEFDSGYQHSLGTTSEIHYQVQHASRHGMLNDIQCTRLTSNMEKFLSTFDMNNVQVGVNLDTQKLVWTPAFEKFCITRQLEILGMHTPFHSLIRYFLKRQELDGVYGNDNRMIEMIAASYELLQRDTTRSFEKDGQRYPMFFKDLQWKFGQRYAAKLEKVISQISPHFDVNIQEINGYPITTLAPRFQVDKEFMALSTESIGAERMECLPLISRALREQHSKGKKKRLLYLIKPPIKNSCLKAIWLVRGESFAQGNVSCADMKRIDKTLSEHDVAKHFTELPTLGQCLMRYRLMEGAVKARGKWVYGYLETRYSFPMEEYFDSVLSDEEEQLKLPLSERVFEPMKLAGYNIKEITSGWELLEEGVELHHCVGGYASQIREKSSIIVSLRKGLKSSDWSTLQLQREKDKWVVRQHRGIQNCEVSEEVAALGNLYCMYVNMSSFFAKPWLVESIEA